jgi:hypothetical protein
MDEVDIALKTVITTSTGVLFAYGLIKGYDTLELLTYNLYFIALLLYLIKTNFLEKK